MPDQFPDSSRLLHHCSVSCRHRNNNTVARCCKETRAAASFAEQATAAQVVLRVQAAPGLPELDAIPFTPVTPTPALPRRGRESDPSPRWGEVGWGAVRCIMPYLKGIGARRRSAAYGAGPGESAGKCATLRTGRRGDRSSGEYRSSIASGAVTGRAYGAAAAGRAWRSRSRSLRRTAVR